jgi:flavin reductase (DIM6/NTAB) family NADH-FMN oxidoreductase RutF
MQKKWIISGWFPEEMWTSYLLPGLPLIDAPYLKEFPLILECKVIQTLEIGLHTQFIGEILDVKADESVLGERGLPDIEKVRPIIFSPEGRIYHRVGKYLGDAFSMGKAIRED